jgi:hypothetical protein
MGAHMLLDLQIGGSCSRRECYAIEQIIESVAGYRVSLLFCSCKEPPAILDSRIAGGVPDSAVVIIW